MSSLTHIDLARPTQVSGSEIAASLNATRSNDLKKYWINCFLEDLDWVTYSSVCKFVRENPESE